MQESLSSTQDQGKEESFIPIPVLTLMQGSTTSFDIYLRQGDGKNNFVLYREANLFLSPERLARLSASGVETFFIKRADKHKQLQYMVRELRRVVEDKDVESLKKAGIVYNFNNIIVRDVLEDPRMENIEICKEAAAQHVAFILSDEEIFRNLFKLMSYDYYTHTHSVNVCTFVVALIRALKLCDKHTMILVGKGALLHDIGKSRIDISILNKTGQLTPEEFEEIKKHPELGLKMVQDNSPVPPVAANIILNHHEKCNGSGYPRGLTGDEIDIYSQITCIVDVFDALTTNRCYKNAFRAFPALEILQNEMHSQVNQELLREFVVLIGRASA